MIFEPIQKYIQVLEGQTAELPEERKQILRKLADYIHSSDPARLIFICTYNSRRSQFCQVWTHVIANYFGQSDIESYSGGIEVTAFHPNAIEALRRTGFQIVDPRQEKPGEKNPSYIISFADNLAPLPCFSKTYDNAVNPRQNFAAVMTCSEADQNCPYVPGTDLRVSLPYKDPKVADGTPEQQKTYDERCRQIAAEMYYMTCKASRDAE